MLDVAEAIQEEGRDVKLKVATRQFEVVDVASPMEEGGDAR